MWMKIRNFTKILNSVFLVSLQLHFLVYHKIADTHTHSKMNNCLKLMDTSFPVRPYVLPL